jgi:hypothetical protein
MAILPEEVLVDRVERLNVGERDERLEIRSHAGWVFAGVLERNCYRETDPVTGKQRTLSYLIQPGAHARFWGGTGYPVHQIEIRDRGAWRVVWDTTNDFKTLEESEADAVGYVAFIEAEAGLLAQRIDDGWEPEAAEEGMNGKGHSGNTAAWSWKLGCDRAHDSARAQRFRDYWNSKWAPDQQIQEGGLVNPAVIVVSDSSGKA